MSKLIPKKPDLFRCPESGEGLPMVFAGRCKCGHLYFPPHLFGCEACGAGAESLTIEEIPAKGKLMAYTAGHLHMRPDGTQPVFIGKIVLDDGPVVVAGINVKDEADIRDGGALAGALIDIITTENGDRIVDLYFRPAGGEK